MALIVKKDPTGIDNSIDKLQKYIYSRISWAGYDYDCTPRAYKNESEKGIVYELFVGGKEYSDTLYDDKVDCKSFFIVSDNSDLSDKFMKVEVKLIVQIDLETCYPSIPHRADEEAHQELRNVVRNNPYGFTLLSMNVGLKNVLNDIDINPVLYTDMQTRHVFSMTFDLNIECCSC